MSFLTEEEKKKSIDLMDSISIKYPFNEFCCPVFGIESGKIIEDMTPIEKQFFFLEVSKNAAVRIPNANHIYIYGGLEIERVNKFGVYKEYQYHVFWEKIDNT